MNITNRCRAAVVGLALLCFFPVVTFEFSGWDDQTVLARNPKLLQPTLPALRAYWSGPEFDLYIPVTQTLWWSIAQVAGRDQVNGVESLRPAMFHAVNLILHAAAALVAFELLRRLRFADVPAAIGAAVFAVHPVQAETVAWAAATKDLLAGGLSIAAIVCYVESVRDRDWPRWRMYLLGSGLFALAMLSKPSAVVVPLLAATIDLLLLRRPSRRVLLTIGPWLVLSIPCVLWTRAFQPGLQTEYVAVPDRLLIAGDAIAFYLRTLLVPAPLGFDYGRTPHAVLASPAVFAAAIAPLLFAAAAAMAWRANRAIGVGGILFVVALLPVLGLVPFDFQMYSTVGDHYLYLSMIGVAMVIAALPWTRGWVWLAVVIIVALAAVAQRQAWTWRTMESMNRRTLAINARSWASHNNLAVALLEQNRLDEAAAAAGRAMELRPGDRYVRRTTLDVLMRRADAAAAGGNAKLAISFYRQAIEIDPRNVAALTNLAATLAERGSFDEAITLYQRAIEAAPSDSAAARAGIEAIQAIRRRPPAATGPT